MTNPEGCHGDLHSVGGGQAGQQAALLSDVLHYHLLPKLRPVAAVSDGNGCAHLASIHRPLSNQQPPCTTVSMGC